MTPFQTTTSRITPIAIKDIDTDMIIPAQYLTQTDTTGFGQHLFERLRSNDPSFALNQDKYKNNTILVARDNFGCGSSREHAVWALLQYGFQVVIAPSFSDIFSNNAPKNGLLLIRLPEQIVEDLLVFEGEVIVDLQSQTVVFGNQEHNFEFDQFRKECILNGYDDLDYLLSYTQEIDDWNDTQTNIADKSFDQSPQSIIQKIWQRHSIVHKPNHPVVFGIDFQLIHEVTSPQAFSTLRRRGLAVKYPAKHIATLDHSIPTRVNRNDIYDEVAKKQVQMLRQNVKDFGIKINDFGSGHQGIVHVMAPEMGLILPGMTVVCGDSHTSTHGAFGAMAFGVGTSEVGLVMATGCILQKEPKTMKVEFQGQLPQHCYSKDMILKLISQIGIGGGNGHIMEFVGQAISDLSVEARMSLCNMSIEAGARAGIINPDQTTFDYLQSKLELTEDEFETQKLYWQSFVSDKDANYDKTVVVDISNLQPQISWGTNPSQTIGITDNIPNEDQIPTEGKNNYHKALEYTKLQAGQKLINQPIDWVFIGSCTNSRLEDLSIVAKIFCPTGDTDQVLKIADNVTCYIVPGSEQVKAQAEQLGLDKIFISAGCDWRMPGCSMCLGMNDDKVPTNKRCVSTSNRNFMHRQGPGSITHLASPATAIWSAINGKISDVRNISN